MLIEGLGWRPPSECLSGPVVEGGGDRVEVVLVIAGHVGAFGKVLAQQPVRVLVGAALPGTVRIAEVDGDAGVDAVICDLGGPYERKGWQLEQLLERAGWADPPAYDGSPRLDWLREALFDVATSPGDVERLICRVCDPLEYDDGAVTAEVFRAELNQTLELEGLTVTYVGRRPVIVQISDADGEPRLSEPPDLDHRLTSLIGDTLTVELLLRRVEETRTCEQNGAYTMAVIGIGSFVEGLLQAVLVQRDTEFRERGVRNANGKWTPPDRVMLDRLVQLAHERGWLQLDVRDFLQPVRKFRNFIHLQAHLRDGAGAPFDADTVKLCWGPVHAVLNDLEVSVPDAAEPTAL